VTRKAPPFSPEIKAAIAKKVQQLTLGNCPMGHVANWLIMDGYSRIQLSPKSDEISLGGSGIPCAVLICTNCGFAAQFALGLLGLLQEEEEA
jgi:hypothetical protein